MYCRLTFSRWHERRPRREPRRNQRILSQPFLFSQFFVPAWTIRMIRWVGEPFRMHSTRKVTLNTLRTFVSTFLFSEVPMTISGDSWTFVTNNIVVDGGRSSQSAVSAGETRRKTRTRLRPVSKCHCSSWCIFVLDRAAMMKMVALLRSLLPFYWSRRAELGLLRRSVEQLDRISAFARLWQRMFIVLRLLFLLSAKRLPWLARWPFSTKFIRSDFDCQRFSLQHITRPLLECMQKNFLNDATVELPRRQWSTEWRENHVASSLLFDRGRPSSMPSSSSSVRVNSQEIPRENFSEEKIFGRNIGELESKSVTLYPIKQTMEYNNNNGHRNDESKLVLSFASKLVGRHVWTSPSETRPLTQHRYSFSWKPSVRSRVLRRSSLVTAWKPSSSWNRLYIY